MDKESDYIKKTEWYYGEPVTVFYPLLSPKYLTDNDLWDSSWLKEKYPERFKNDGTTSTGEED
tara:strand:+ start:282 stop:470 length:189 start_codon:yes stop_codon:yes gene_type:complete